MGKRFLAGTISDTSRTAPVPKTRICLPRSEKSVNLKTPYMRIEKYY